MDDQTYQIIGAAFEVHRELGCGFLDSVYQEALELEFNDRKIPFRAQAEMPVFLQRAKTDVIISCGVILVTTLSSLNSRLWENSGT